MPWQSIASNLYKWSPRVLTLVLLPCAAADTDTWLRSLAAGDECHASAAAKDESSACAVSALQLRSLGTVQELAEMHMAKAAMWQAELLALNISVPERATDHDGIRWPALSVQESGVADGFTHVFAIGDWGAPLPNHIPFPHVRRIHHVKRKCPLDCGYVPGVDDMAQLLVANQFLSFASVLNPRYVLNVGDNFYPQGLKDKCDLVQASQETIATFNQGWRAVYGGLTKIPWLSVLGNHDYGGWTYSNGWSQQIGYSYVDRNWVMPARYFSRRMHHEGFSVDYFMLDTNSFDAHWPFFKQESNICSHRHNGNNGLGVDCAKVGGPNSTKSCKSWFKQSYEEQKHWLRRELEKSDAAWQIVVTHFPCDVQRNFWKEMHKVYGLDLVVTGHRHKQELWNKSLGGITCIVTGGGGGITSEDPPIGGLATHEYGFFDLAISRAKILINSVNIYGRIISTASVYPTQMARQDST